MDKNNEKDPWYCKTTEQGELKVRWGRIASALVGVCFLSGSVVGGLGIGLSSHEEAHTTLTERIKYAYQRCQEIEDKSQSVEYVSYQYATCREVEDLYLKVSPK